MKIIWLASWYPTQLTPYDGDFIQRHARAAALYNQIQVIHVIEDRHQCLTSFYEVEERKDGNLTETIVSFKTNYKIIFLEKLAGNYYYKKYNRRIIEEYIKQYGKPELIHVHVPVKAGRIALWANKKFNIPFVVTEHWAIYNNIVPDRYENRKFWFKYLTKQIIKKCQLLLPVSKNLGNSINQLVTEKNYVVVPNSVDTSCFNYNQKTLPLKFRFLHVSSMKSFQKNPEGILRAAVKLKEEHSSFELVFAGPHSQAFENACDEYNLLNKFIFLRGEVSYENVAEEMKKASAFILFSRYENLPCVILEALCSGLPVITTAVGGIPEVVNSFNGILLNNDDEDELLKAMGDMIKNYESFNRKKIAEDSCAQFNYKKIGGEIDSIYNQLINKTI